MARPQELKEPIRVNYVIEKRQDKALRELAYNTNRNLSELIRMAIDNFLEMDYDAVEKPVRGELADILKLLEHLVLKTRKGEARTEWDLKRSDLSLLFGSQWWKLRSVVDLTVSAMNTKQVDAMHEEVVHMVEVPGTTRLRQEKIGFRLFVPAGLTKDSLRELIVAIEQDAKRYGYVRIGMNGNGNGKGEKHD